MNLKRNPKRNRTPRSLLTLVFAIFFALSPLLNHHGDGSIQQAHGSSFVDQQSTSGDTSQHGVATHCFAAPFCSLYLANTVQERIPFSTARRWDFPRSVAYIPAEGGGLFRPPRTV